MDLQVILHEYLAYSKRNKSEATYERYDTPHLTLIINFLIGKGYLTTQELDYEAIYSFIDYSKSRNNANKTMNKRIQLLNRAIKFQVKQGKCDPTIIATYDPLREINKRFEIVDEDTMKKVINYMLSLPDSFLTFRNRVILFLFIDTGARLSEVTNIKISNIDFNNNTILLNHTKTKNEREIFFSNFTSEHLQAYLNLHDPNEDALLVGSVKKEPMSYLGVLRVVQKVKYVLNLKKFSSHMIRHSYITLGYEKEVSEFFLNKSAGHQRMDQTRAYVHYKTKTNVKIYKKLAPMEHYTNKK